jgi:myo-inositol 2-dehydrogenase / D-chiro-inositol 1-dehydrogenase
MGLTGYYMAAPGYFAGNVDYTGFFLHHCVHYMDLVSFLVPPVRTISARKVEKTPGRLLFHLGFEFECGAIGNIAMGTIQSRGTPVERIELMSDHQRVEVDDVIEIKWHRNPPFKIDDLGATLKDDSDTLMWKPNFTAAANEDPKGYHSLLADVVPALAGASTPAPSIADGVIAMERLEILRAALDI